MALLLTPAGWAQLRAAAPTPTSLPSAPLKPVSGAAHSANPSGAAEPASSSSADAGARSSGEAGLIVPPLTAGPTDGPGLYAGLKDRSGTAVSWVRINGLKERGELIPVLRVRWGGGLVELPLVDISRAELFYSEGHIQTVVHLLSGEIVRAELANPYTELQGWWRQNSYTIPLSEIRQAWFQYVPEAKVSPEHYAGPARQLKAQGYVKDLDISQTGGILRMTVAGGDTLELPWKPSQLRSGQALLTSKAYFLPGRWVGVTYLVSATADGHAKRSLLDVRLIKERGAR
jgi:hypothetical protein